MTYITFKEHLTLLEARKEGGVYTEKQVKGVLERVTIALEGTESANMTKVAKRYARLEVSLKAMKEKHEKLNEQLKETVQGLFDAEDVVLTRVVETAQFTLTMAKEIKKTEPTKSVDYEKIAAELAKLIPAELQEKIDEITKQYTNLIPPKDPVKKLSVSKEVVKEGIFDSVVKLKNWAMSMLKKATSWAAGYDSKLNNLKKQAGMKITEGIHPALVQAKLRHDGKLKATTPKELLKALDQSSLPQRDVNAVKELLSSNPSMKRISVSDLRQICQMADLDEYEVFNLAHMDIDAE